MVKIGVNLQKLSQN